MTTSRAGAMGASDASPLDSASASSRSRGAYLGPPLRKVYAFGGIDYSLAGPRRPAEGEPDVQCGCTTPGLEIDEDVRNGEYFTISSCSSPDTELINAAWSLLVQNLDLVADAALAYAPGRMLTLQNEVLGREFLLFYYRQRVELQCVGLAFSAQYVPDEDLIRIDDSYLMELGYRWDVADAAGGRSQRKGQACVASDLAATLLHELVHADGDFAVDIPDGGFDSYRIENHFRYFLMKRLCVLGWGCCNWQKDEKRNYDLLVLDPTENSDSYLIGKGANSCNDEGEAC